jgi:hypothetical protein
MDNNEEVLWLKDSSERFAHTPGLGIERKASYILARTLALNFIPSQLQGC